jgi:purine-nucleoside phosphorylase
VSSAHIAAAAGEIADSVLLPGDPLRARHIAKQLLDDAREVTARRNMLGYTGTWKGRPVSVIGSGMGIPSCALYATELARHYGVRRILRVGTCGGLSADLELGDVVLAQAASTDSGFNRLHFGGHDFAACADFALLGAAVECAARLRMAVRVGGVFSTDVFYSPDPALPGRLRDHRILAVEMESAGLYGVAAREGVQALSLLCVSDRLPDGGAMSPEAREQGVDALARLALEALGRGAA